MINVVSYYVNIQTEVSHEMDSKSTHTHTFELYPDSQKRQISQDVHATDNDINDNTKRHNLPCDGADDDVFPDRKLFIIHHLLTALQS